MKTKQLLSLIAACLLTFTACQPAAESTTEATSTEETTTDLSQIKAEIQTLENAWADAQNAKNVEALLAMYTDDAISMTNDAPSTSGKDALRKSIETDFASSDSLTSSYETLEVYGDENTVTEIGKSTQKDAAGNVVNSGKYVAIWVKQGDTYLCSRDIYNRDAPAKPKAE
jgi:uncharacterized protein (TIGR02246 family)